MDSIKHDLTETIGRRHARPGCLQAAGQKRRPHIEMGKYADEEDVDFDVKSKVNYVHELEFKQLHHGLFLLFNLSW